MKSNMNRKGGEVKMDSKGSDSIHVLEISVRIVGVGWWNEVK